MIQSGAEFLSTRLSSTVGAMATHKPGFDPEQFFACIENNRYDEFIPQLTLLTDLNITSATDKWTPLMAASFFLKREKFLTALLEAKADPNVTDESGDFPLFVAAERNNNDAIDLLLCYKADVNKRASDGMTALHVAASKSHVEALESLLIHDPIVDAENAEGLTALAIAEAVPGVNPKILEQLNIASGEGASRAGSIGAPDLLQAVKQAVNNHLCTITGTGNEYVKQKWWLCKTCSTPEAPFGVCEVCCSCHEGHTLVAQRAAKFYCDCGSDKEHCKCLSIKMAVASAADVEKYQRAVELVLCDGSVTAGESTYLFELRNKLHVTEDQHAGALAALGMTEAKFQEAHKLPEPAAAPAAAGDSKSSATDDDADDRMVILAKEALVVGISNYTQAGAALKNPRNDATRVDGVLRGLGFNTTLVLDIMNYSQWITAAEEFLGRLQKHQEKHYGCVAVFYFAGHAVEIKGSNYLLHGEFSSADMAAQGYASKDITSDTLENYMSSQWLLAAMERACNTCLMVLDACRNNPFAPAPVLKKVKKGKGSSGGAAKPAQGNIVPLYPTGSSLVLLSTAPGFTAGDGSASNPDNGMFTHSLLQWLPRRDLHIEEIAYKVSRDVFMISAGKQHPWRHSALLRKVYLGDSVANK